MEKYLGILFVFQYCCFVGFFYLIFTTTPYRLNLKISYNEKEVDNIFINNFFTFIICVAWIVVIPWILINSYNNLKNQK